MSSAADAAPSFLHLPELASLPEAFTLAEEDARYVSRVVRARVGERLTVSDGAGTVAELELVSLRPDVAVRVLGRRLSATPASRTLLVGAPEGERGDWLVEKCAELGVTHLCPVDTSRARWPEGTRLDRWRRLAVAALRQSQGAWLMRLGAPMPLAEALAGLPAGPRWLADPAGAPAAALHPAADGPLSGAVGPSSGFSVEELKLLADNGFLPVCLAASRLRSETAALALAAVWAAAGGQRPKGA